MDGTICSMVLASTRREFEALCYVEQFGTPADLDRYRALAGKRPLTR